jgi:predicted signal transduction protein with EAL and GGDEF domain
LLSNCRNTDIVSRLGGDEFIILVRNVENESGLAAQANQIIKKLQKPFQLEGATVLIGATIGIAVFPKDADTSDQLLKHADAAMYHAKSLGRGCFSFFDFSINARNQRIIRLKQAMRTAIKQNEYRLVYQPQIDPNAREITGYEALIRWESEELGHVSPAEFIPVAEDSGEIDRITHWVIQQVAEDRKQSSVLGGHTVSINISAKQFQNDSWVNTLRTMSEEHRLDLSSIVVEVTETALVAEFDSTLEQLKAIRRLGVRVAIDDFGTGYSSLAYLKKMPINYLKIDRTFVSDIGIDSDDQTIVQTVIAMAHALDITVIAEGAESIEQVAFLTANGCDKIQGYYYSKPLELAEVDTFALP